MPPPKQEFTQDRYHPPLEKPNKVISEQQKRAAEIVRKNELLERLRQEYMLSHDNLSPALIAGMESPPSEWTNRRLRELGETWRVAGKPAVAAVLKPDSNQQPDVGLRFTGAKSPALVIINRSDVVARQIKWSVILFNLNHPDRKDPLPIPISTFDFIKGQNEGGPQNLFDAPSVSSLIKLGDRLIGSATVDCPDCSRGRTYIVSIVFGESGWFAEDKEESGKFFVPTDASSNDFLAKFAESMESRILPKDRMSIQ